MPPGRIPIFETLRRGVLPAASKSNILCLCFGQLGAEKNDQNIQISLDYSKMNFVIRKDAYSCRGSTSLKVCVRRKIFSLYRPNRRQLSHQTCCFPVLVHAFDQSYSPASFVRMMEVVQTGLQWLRCLVYLDALRLSRKPRTTSNRVLKVAKSFKT